MTYTVPCLIKEYYMHWWFCSSLFSPTSNYLYCYDQFNTYIMWNVLYQSL